MNVLQFPSLQQRIFPENIKLVYPSTESQDSTIIDRIKGSFIGLAIGDAVGASVEFRPREYLIDNPVLDMMSGGTWGLSAGKWTDDTSMALCLASSLITQKCFNAYDQMVRYKWWYKDGYLSSTGFCFDIGNATRNALDEFETRQSRLKKLFKCRNQSEVDQLSLEQIRSVNFDVNCSDPYGAGNGALMRLAPVPLFFYRTPIEAVKYSGESARMTHGDNIAIDACRYYGALIVAAVHGETKENLLSDQFYDSHQKWFSSLKLHDEVLRVAAGSFKKSLGYDDGIRGKGHVIESLEAALWAFWSADNFKDGLLKAVNLGDDTDTTAAIYGQLAGAYYGYEQIPKDWRDKLYASNLFACTAEWLAVLGQSDTHLNERAILSRTLSMISESPRTVDGDSDKMSKSESIIEQISQPYFLGRYSKSVPRYPRSGILFLD